MRSFEIGSLSTNLKCIVCFNSLCSVFLHFCWGVFSFMLVTICHMFCLHWELEHSELSRGARSTAHAPSTLVLEV